MTEPRSEYFRPNQAPNVIGVSRATIYRWIKRGILTPVTHGSFTWIKTKQAIDYIESLGD